MDLSHVEILMSMLITQSLMTLGAWLHLVVLAIGNTVAASLHSVVALLRRSISCQWGCMSKTMRRSVGALCGISPWGRGMQHMITGPQMLLVDPATKVNILPVRRVGRAKLPNYFTIIEATRNMYSSDMSPE